MNTHQNHRTYSIGDLANIADVSTRTLRYYDQIGLLDPGFREENNYRTYTFDNMLRLQQIMFFRELDIPLRQIKNILENPETNPRELLKAHYENLERQIKRLKTLQITIQKTIKNLDKENIMPMTDEELYEGFSKETIERYNREAREKYGSERFEQVDRKVRGMSKAHWEKVKEEGGKIAQSLAKFMDRDPKDPEVQVLIARQHAWIENFYAAPADLFRNLGDMYANHPEFRAFYDQYGIGLAEFMRDAMRLYADTVLAENSK